MPTNSQLFPQHPGLFHPFPSIPGSVLVHTGITTPVRRYEFPQAPDRVRNQKDIQRVRDVEIPDTKRKVVEKQLEAEINARLKAFKKSLAAHGNPEPSAVVDHAPKRRKLTALHG
ncbi:hypothetical protein DL767_010568 [Monosporascus sp. MG133]|nr:hypothetical protein DL767_010568 [Monosporascus sp. MG133]